MKGHKVLSLIFLFSFLFIINNPAQVGQDKDELLKKIEKLPGIISVEKLKDEAGYNGIYKIMVEQLLDHQNPGGEKFQQKIYLSDKNFDAPMVVSTEGYAAFRNYLTEPAKLLNANQIIVENRFFNESKPVVLKWEFLTSGQCAEDLHHITSIF